MAHKEIKKEELKPNEVGATLFVGVGGIGSKIINGIATRAVNDNIDSVRFCVLDTDVNDMSKLSNAAMLGMIQTSSPRSIKDYLANDTHAKNHWFPENRIIDDKTVSEGAGQIRAISRLAVNATIKQGNINTLYRCIDELYLKDGADKKQAVKIVIASTAAGGTGSGIAMIVGMLVRQYIRKNYPESAAIIRGLLLLPGVLDTVIDTESERESLRRNGYASIKEVNAFMMKGSGFFDSVPELRRYKDLHISVPTTAAGVDRLDCLPFDFCFLMDRTDSNQGSMQTLGQYIESAAQSLYEQNIGPMKKGASSKEDNIIKEFINPEKLGRCRFGGIGSAILRYPYESVRDYVSCNWLISTFLGETSSVSNVDDLEQKSSESWIKYDRLYDEKISEFNKNAYASVADKPEKHNVYIEAVENIRDNSRFAEMIRMELERKIADLPVDDKNSGDTTFAGNMSKVINNYVETVVAEAVRNHIEKAIDSDSLLAAEKSAEQGNLAERYEKCLMVSGMVTSGEAENIAESFAKNVFTSRNPILNNSNKDYSFEQLFKAGKNVLHPNAVRYLLYKFAQYLDDEKNKRTIDIERYEKLIDKVTKGINDKGEIDVSEFQVLGGGKEFDLETMCKHVDGGGKLAENKVEECNKKLKTFINYSLDEFKNIAYCKICVAAKDIVGKLSKAYEDFYDSFDSEMRKVVVDKESVVGKLKFNNGDSCKYICGKEKYLDGITQMCREATNEMDLSSDLSAGIFDRVRMNMFNVSAAALGYDVSDKVNVFDAVIVPYFRNLVVDRCGTIINKDILRALKLEFEIKYSLGEIKIKAEDGELKDAAYARTRDAYIKKEIASAQILAAPSIINNNFDERREVSAITYNDKIEDGEGIRIANFLSRAEPSDTVSKYELRFFRSLYNVMPTQLSKFCDPDAIEDGSAKPLDLEGNQQRRGEYFRAYQTYMEDIGPDCKKNAVITPHIDKRWNSISVMPELDLDYQHGLMMYIQQAFFYGVLFERIERRALSKYDTNRKVYRYIAGDDIRNLTVSNGTECDLPYEILDALYFDRAAVKSIHKYEREMRAADEAESYSYESTKFCEGMNNFCRECIVDQFEEELPEFEGKDTAKTSVFELPMIYYNSLPPQKKDLAEINTLVEAIISAIEKQVTIFMDSNDVRPYLANILVEHFNLFVDNYRRYPRQLGKGIEIAANDVVSAIRKKVVNFIEGLDVSESFVAGIKSIRDRK